MSERVSKADLVILCDTREQLPLTLPNFRRATLATGDYSVEGYEQLIAVERKSHADFAMCVGQERERFERCLARLATMEYPALVLECGLSDLLAGTRYSAVHPASVAGSLIAWSTKYRLPVWLAGNRDNAAMVVTKILHAAVRYHEEGLDDGQR
jgi:ERCC4-type nuclease